MKVRRLVDIRVTCEPPGWAYGYSSSLEYQAQKIEGWAREFEAFVRDHRSQDAVDLTVERVYREQCSLCNREWEEDADGPLCCDAAHEAWLAEHAVAAREEGDEG